MPSMLEIPRDIAAKLTAQAEAEGLAVEDYLRRLLDEKSSGVGSPNGKARVERVRLFDEWIAGLDANTPALWMTRSAAKAFTESAVDVLSA